MAGLLSLSSTWQTTARANSSNDSANTAKRRWNYPAPFFIGDTAYGQATEKIRYHRAMGQTVEIAGQTVSIHYSGNALVSYDPIVYLHSLKGNGSEVWGQCQSLNCPPFTLISIPTPNWNNSLTPWKCEGLFAEDKPFEGNARQHLLQLETMVAQTEQHLETTPHHRCIAGYSLAGLFATWAPFNTTLFDALASASGSLWYPDFSEYVSINTFAKKPLCAYFPSVQKKQKHPAAFFAAFRKEQKALFRRFRKKALKPSLSQIPETTSKNPTCAWPRVSVGCFANSIDRTGLLNTFMVFAL